MKNRADDLNEDVRELEAAAKAASDMALREARALGLTIRFIEDGIVYDKFADGTRKVVAVMEKDINLNLKAGTVLHVKS